MKLFFTFIIAITLTDCNHPDQNNRLLQIQVDSLQQKLEHSYKPGLGEFMSNIQVHHAKLWFAGLAENWPLSEFESTEIGESLEDIQLYCSDRAEVKSISMIYPALDSINASIKNKSISEFKRNFNLLTNTCNNCHRVTKHEFNVIRIPETPPFSNQVYSTPAIPR